MLYLPLCILVGVVWLWLAGGAIYGYRKQSFGPLMMLGSVGLVTVGAIWVLLSVGPYGGVIYDTIGQPG